MFLKFKMLGLWLIFACFCMQAHAENCELVFSRLHYEQQVINKKAEYEKFHSTFSSITKDRELQKLWNTPKSAAKFLQLTLPKDVHFITHQLRQAHSQSSIKVNESGATLMLRAGYAYKKFNLQTNVAVNKHALTENILNPENKKFLVRKQAKAAILFLHGGGTKSTGGHTAETLINHFAAFNIDVISPDLSWHAEGPREFIGSLSDEILALSAFVKKYIPKNVPVFVWGHSWGATYAEQIMRMTEDPNFVFHPSLKGSVIASPPADAAPGKSFEIKTKEDIKNRAHVQKELLHKSAQTEKDIFNQMISDGKISPVGGFFAEFTTKQSDQTIPKHGGDLYIPSILIVGEADSLVYLGSEKLFHNYYDKLSNLKTYYLKDLLLVSDPGMGPQRVGHLIRDYINPVSSTTPVDIYYVKQFIKDRLQTELPKTKLESSNLTVLINLWANNLAFRLWLKDYELVRSVKTQEFSQIREDMEKLSHKVRDVFLPWILPNQINNFINNLKNESKNDTKSHQNLQEIARNIHNIIVFKTKHQGFLNEKLKDLIFKISEQKDVKSMQDILQQALNASDDKKQYIPKRVDSINKKQQDLVQFRKILKQQSLYKDIDDPLDESLDLDYFLDILNLPEYIQNQILVLSKEIQSKNQQLNNSYIPSIKELSKLNSNSSEEELKAIQKKLENNIYKRKNLNEDIKNILKEKQELSQEYQDALKDVTIHIKQIRLALGSTQQNIPKHLTSDYKKIQKKLALVSDFSNQMDNTISQLTIKILGVKNNIKDIDQIFSLQNNKNNIEQLNMMYADYVKDVTRFKKKKMITAMERGHLGNDFKKNVLAIFGKNSQGNHPDDNIDNSYTNLKKIITRIAEIEHQLFEHHQIDYKLRKEYYSLQTLKLEIFTSYKPIEIFEGNEGDLNINWHDLSKISDNLDKFKFIIKAVVVEWKKLQSQSPPELPI